jgi:DNA polymerase I-like protein with 3'-5' exonuclease and polymerase domains
MWKIEGMIKERAARSKDGVGYVTGFSGRKYYCEADKAYRATNYLIQGESAMFFKVKMVALSQFLKGKKTKLINVIHDEFIFDLAVEERSLCPQILELIEDHTTYRVPIFANATISETNWAEKHPLSLGTETLVHT